MRRPTILIVEDNAADAGLVIDALADSVWDPALVVETTGTAALERLRGRGSAPQPDLVLLDLNLPGFNGLQTLAVLKGDPDLCCIPVIVLTTSKSQVEINRCYAAGAAAVLNKSLRLKDHDDMLAALARFWLGHVRLPEAA